MFNKGAKTMIPRNRRNRGGGGGRGGKRIRGRKMNEILNERDKRRLDRVIIRSKHNNNCILHLMFFLYFTLSSSTLQKPAPRRFG